MNKRILQLAIPSILANITIPLVGLVDTAIVGHIADASVIGGIAIGTMLFDLLYWNFAFLRVGTSGMTAQAVGRNDQTECAQLLLRSGLIALLGAFAIWALQWVFVQAVLMVVPCSPQVAQFAREYFLVRVWAAPATLSLMAFKGWFIGMQDTVSPMLTDIVVNVVNMGISYYLAVHTPLGAIGVAYGTLVAQYSGLLLAFILLYRRYRHVFFGIDFKQVVGDMAAIRRLLSLNGNLFLRSLCFMVVYVGFTSLSSRYGDTFLASSAIVMKLMMLFSFFVDGFAYAGEALVGRYIGEHNNQMLQLSIRNLFIWSLSVGILFTLVYWVAGVRCIGWLTTDRRVLADAIHYLPWLIAMPLLSTLAFMWDGVYAGATAGREIRNAMIYAAIGFVLGYWATYTWAGAHALYIAYFIHLIARVAYLSIRWRKVYDRQIS